MKTKLFLFLLLCCIFHIAAEEFEYFANGIKHTRADIKLPYSFDGKGFIGIPCRNTKAQAYAAVMSFPEKPSGELISRHSPRDGKRGIEIGLSGKAFHQLNGSKLTLLASSGTRKYIAYSVSGTEFAPVPGEKYLLTLSFEPNGKLTSFVVRLRDRMCIRDSQVNVSKISSLTEHAGEGYLAIGGRIAELKNNLCEYPVKAGTVLHKLEIFNRPLNYSDIEKLAGGELCYPEVNGDDHVDRKVGDSWCEARRYIDKVSGLPVMQLTTRGIYNQGPTVHYGTAFPGGKDEISFASIRNGISMLMTGNIKTGMLKVHYTLPKLPIHKRFRTAADLFGGAYGVQKTIQGINTSASLHHRNVAFYVPLDDGFKMINLDTGKITMLIDKKDFPDIWFTTPVFSGDGKFAAVCSRKINGDTDTGRPTVYYLTELATGKVSVAYKVFWGQTHFFSNPVYPDIWIVKQFKPAFMERDKVKRDKIRKTADCYFVDIKTGKTTPILPRNPEKNITHLEWTGDGKYLVYHGTADAGGTFVGAINTSGKVVWEYIDTSWNHKRNGLSHVCADSTTHSIIDDGLMVKNQISLIDWRNAGSHGRPLVVPLAHWENHWIPGQFGHPHPAVSPDGNYVIFYGCRDGNTQIYVIDISSVKARLFNNNGVK